MKKGLWDDLVDATEDSQDEVEETEEKTEDESTPDPAHLKMGRPLW